jgi:D-sedoheptulose 7-phosphate isomerase
VAEDALAEHAALVARIGELVPRVDVIAARVIEAYERGGSVFAFGNGGSAAEAQHLAAELVGRYRRDRRPLAAAALSADSAALTCIGNDYSFDDVFARQVQAFAGPEDVVFGFTTSGRSPNVVRGLAAARERQAATVLFSGGDGGPAADHADHALIVPSSSTARIQEMHVLLVHLLAERIDAWAAGEGDT